MYLCAGTFLTALKMCKAPPTKQKELGEAVFCSLYSGFNCGDDDSAISAVFRGRRNINSYLQIMMDDLEPTAVAGNFEKRVLPLLDENKFSFLVRLIQNLIEQDEIDDETHVELVNMIKKKDLIKMNEVVLEDFLAGILLYIIKNTNNLNKEMEVNSLRHQIAGNVFSEPERVNFITQYSSNSIFHNERIRPVQTLYKQSGGLIDIICADLFEICKKSSLFSKTNIVIPVNTTFETKLEERVGDSCVPLVSLNTIHGQWIEFIQKKGVSITEINKVIKEDLWKNRISKCGVSGFKSGKQDIYPMASIVCVPIDNINYYLVAIAEFDEKNRAISNPENIKKSIDALIEYYDSQGQGFDLYIPLIGSGRSRTGMSSQDSFELIKEILLERRKTIYGRVHIVVRENQMDEIRVDE